ncbi:MAG: delta 1-pyrroline-5-carboxylate synthetase [Gammaproteobacteria bacterium]|nr:MAG: delta 1-pyrroline-5-carboxylate synthetase [Gammaproteobacteria bacterium]
MRPLIIKLGGSLYAKPELKHWLDALTEYSKQQDIIIVPGGGPFADQVRTAQTAHHFSDKTAHHMAIFAMKQFALLLNDLAVESSLFDSDRPLIKTPYSIWLPNDSLLNQSSLKHSWDLTSDSLALWLASHLNAEQLVLIKCTDINSNSIIQLSKDAVLDAEFANLFKQYSIPTKIVRHQQYADIPAALAQATLLQL